MIYYRKRFYPSSARFPRKGYRRTYKKKVSYRRKSASYVPRSMAVANVVHMKLCGNPYFSSPTNVPTNLYGATFTAFIVQCWRYNQLLNVFQQYRINKVVSTFTPCTNVRDDTDFLYSGSTQVATPADRGTLYVAVDYEDASTPTSVADLLSYPRVKMVSAHKPFSIKYTPAVQSVAYQSGPANGYAPKFKQWIHREDYNVGHYGLKYMVANPEATIGGSGIVMPRWKIQHFYYVSFKQPHMVSSFSFPDVVTPGESVPDVDEDALAPVHDDSMHAEPDYELTEAGKHVTPPAIKRGSDRFAALHRTYSAHNAAQMANPKLVRKIEKQEEKKQEE